jgi:hypothetical protein
MTGAASHPAFCLLEVEADLCRQSPRCHIVRATEGRQVVVQGIFVENIHARQPEAPLVLVTAEEIVFADRSIEQASFLDARRILVVVLGSWSRYRDEIGGQL